MMSELRVDTERLKGDLLELSRFGRLPEGGVSRLGFSETDLEARRWLVGKMREAGLEVWTDAAANVHGRRRGRDPDLPVLLFGSHIDSVPEGGIFDGTLGVLGALEVLRALEERGLTTRHPLEMVIWADEEGVHFGQGLFGSRAATSGPKRSELDLVGSDGRSLSEWLARYGRRPAEIDSAALEPAKVAAYLELHIEQGPALDREEIDIGVVEGIVGIYRFEATVEGFANHAGTTPMAERKDAMLSAAKLTQAVREEVMARPGRQVGNVGLLRASPGAPNVVAGKVTFPIELRDLEERIVFEVLERIRARASRIGAEDGTTVRVEPFASEGPAPTETGLQEEIERQARGLGLSTKRLPSGAGHDAQSVSRHGIPTGMIFVPSRNGVSHNPAEWTDWEEAARGVDVLGRVVQSLDEKA